MKKLLIIGGILMLVMGAIGTVGLVYVGYRVKNRLERVAAEARPEPTRRVVRAEAAPQRPDVCSLLTRDEASQILEVPIERTRSGNGAEEGTCQYFAKPRTQRDQAASIADALKAMSSRQGPEPSANPNEAYALPRQAGTEEIMKRIGGLAVGRDAPYVTVTVNWDGGRSSIAMLKGIATGEAPGVKTTEDLVGIGDEAIMGPVDSMLAFVKGPTAVQLDLRLVPHGRDKGVAMARKIAGRL